MLTTLVCFTFLYVVCLLTERINGNTTEWEVLGRLLDPAIYDATIRPGAEEGDATRVEIDMALNSVGPINDINMEISTSFFLRQQWRDPRLRYDDFNRSIVISYKRLSSLWVPDLYFTQSKEENLHVVTTPNVMIRLFPDGSVLYTQSFTDDALYFQWSDTREKTSLQPEASIPDFTITDVAPEDCSSTYAVGRYSCLRAVIHLRREIGFYATQTYIPSILIVVLSWASFWIDHEAVPARISVGLLTVLTITTQSSGALEQLPRVPYVKSIDVWMILCLVFVFAAYIEFAIVMVLSRVSKKRTFLAKNKQKIYASDVSDVSDVFDNGTMDLDITKTETSCQSGSDVTRAVKPRDPGSIVDKISRSVFPIAFIIFNIAYWIYYKLTD